MSLLEFDVDFKAKHAYKEIIGVDEVGLGCLAGNVVAAAAILDYAKCKDVRLYTTTSRLCVTGRKCSNKVKVFNDRGTVLITARVSPRIRPGVTNIPQGAWHKINADGVDEGGCANVLTKYHPTPFAKGNPQHTNLVEVEKA